MEAFGASNGAIWPPLPCGTGVPAGAAATRAVWPATSASSAEGSGGLIVDGRSSNCAHVVGGAPRRCESCTHATPAQSDARACVQADPGVGPASRGRLQRRDGRCVDALRIGWLWQRRPFAHSCEHISGRRMFACRVVQCSRAQFVVRVGCGVRARLGRSARASGESAWHLCLPSRRVVVTSRVRGAGVTGGVDEVRYS